MSDWSFEFGDEMKSGDEIDRSLLTGLSLTNFDVSRSFTFKGSTECMDRKNL